MFPSKVVETWRPFAAGLEVANVSWLPRVARGEYAVDKTKRTLPPARAKSPLYVESQNRKSVYPLVLFSLILAFLPVSARR